MSEKFEDGAIKFQEISRRDFKFQEIPSISRSCRHPDYHSVLTYWIPGETS